MGNEKRGRIKITQLYGLDIYAEGSEHLTNENTRLLILKSIHSDLTLDEIKEKYG